MSDKPDRAHVTVPDKPNAMVRDRPSLPTTRYLAGDEIARATLDPEMLRRSSVARVG